MRPGGRDTRRRHVVLGNIDRAVNRLKLDWWAAARSRTARRAARLIENHRPAQVIGGAEAIGDDIDAAAHTGKGRNRGPGAAQIQGRWNSIEIKGFGSQIVRIEEIQKVRTAAVERERPEDAGGEVLCASPAERAPDMEAISPAAGIDRGGGRRAADVENVRARAGREIERGAAIVCKCK